MIGAALPRHEAGPGHLIEINDRSVIDGEASSPEKCLFSSYLSTPVVSYFADSSGQEHHGFSDKKPRYVITNNFRGIRGLLAVLNMMRMFKKLLATCTWFGRDQF